MTYNEGQHTPWCTLPMNGRCNCGVIDSELNEQVRVLKLQLDEARDLCTRAVNRTEEVCRQRDKRPDLSDREMRAVINAVGERRSAEWDEAFKGEGDALESAYAKLAKGRYK